jgi:glycosyltransferase involved in cell wall biosynthesis
VSPYVHLSYHARAVGACRAPGEGAAGGRSIRSEEYETGKEHEDPRADRAPRLWLDVEDLFEYARANPRPSGVQRVAFEIYRTLQDRHGASGLIRFVRHDPARNSFRSITWPEIEALFTNLATQERRQLDRVDSIRPRSPSFRTLRMLIHRLPPWLRARMVEAVHFQLIACRAWARFGLTLVRGSPRLATSLIPRKRATYSSRNDFVEMAKPGDLLLALGAPWAHPDYASFIRVQCAERGLRFVLLIYDLIPVRHPEWCDRGLVRVFRAWIESILPRCWSIFAISQATARDLMAYSRERGIDLPRAVPLPMGTSFGSEYVEPRRTERVPPPGTYALFVSTIEARKNHSLLFRVWQRLLSELPGTKVPTLVFAGRVGWLVDDLMRQIANTDNLHGCIVIVEDPTDAELAALYQGCLFTLFPSFYEGWGLPVSESLSFGKPCVIADRTSSREAGGELVRCFDPDNLHDAYAVIRDVIVDREGLALWEARVRQEFRPVPWSATVQALLQGVGHPLADGREERPMKAVSEGAAVAACKNGQGERTLT